MQEGKISVRLFFWTCQIPLTFDTLNHDTLLDKLSYLCISGISKHLLASYVSNRLQIISFDNQNGTNYKRGQF